MTAFPMLALLLTIAVIAFVVTVSQKLVSIYRSTKPAEEAGPDVNFFRDMRGRLGEFQRMRNWCAANIGKRADSADTVTEERVFYIGKKMSAMQFVFYNQSDFDLFNQHWTVVQEQHERHS